MLIDFDKAAFIQSMFTSEIYLWNLVNLTLKKHERHYGCPSGTFRVNFEQISQLSS